MEIRKLIFLGWITFAWIRSADLTRLLGQEEEPLARRILRMSEEDQIAWLNAYWADGLPPSDVVGVLILGKPSLTLPLFEKKIEEVLWSPSPQEFFKNHSVDPQRIVDFAARGMTFAGNEVALQQPSKLMKIDEQRFGDLVGATFLNARSRTNPFTVAYKGFEIGDAAVDKRIVAWAEKQFRSQEGYERDANLRQWSEAMVGKYDREPSRSEWSKDPLVSGLKASADDNFYNEMRRYTAEAAQRRSKP